MNIELCYFVKQKRKDCTLAIFYFLIGIPASGKSTFARSLNCKIVCPDEIRIKQRVRSEKAFKIARRSIVTLLQHGDDVVFDATNTIAYWRKDTIQLAKNYADEIICIVMDTDLSECLRRHKKRVRQGIKTSLPEGVICRMSRQLKKNKPILSEGFDKIIFSSELKKIY